MAMQIQRYTPWQDGGNTYEDDNGGYVLYSDVEEYANARVREAVEEISVTVTVLLMSSSVDDEEYQQFRDRYEEVKAKVLEAYPVEVKG